MKVKARKDFNLADRKIGIRLKEKDWRDGTLKLQSSLTNFYPSTLIIKVDYVLKNERGRLG